MLCCAMPPPAAPNWAAPALLGGEVIPFLGCHVFCNILALLMPLQRQRMGAAAL